jgi:hypothetical protein
MGNTFTEVMDETKLGFAPVPSQRFSEAQIAGCLDMIRNADHLPAHRHEYLMKEAITTSDFPLLFGATIERELVARYRFSKIDMSMYIKQTTVPNFNAHTRDRLDGLTGLLPPVSEKGEYLVSTKPTQNRTSIQVSKRGAQFDISWEALINDGLGAFSDIAQRYADAAINTEAQGMTGLTTTTTGPIATMYAAPITLPDGSTCTNVGVLDLTIANLETTLGLLAAQAGPNGDPLGLRGKYLVVPPSLELRARAILTSTLILSTAAAPIPATNVLPQMGLQLIVNPWLPIVDTSGNRNGTWYLFADTTQCWAAEWARLRGHEAPEICMKSSDKVSPTGSLISPFDGDFASDNVFYRVRVVGGGTALDPRATYAQVHT